MAQLEISGKCSEGLIAQADAHKMVQVPNLTTKEFHYHHVNTSPTALRHTALQHCLDSSMFCKGECSL